MAMRLFSRFNLSKRLFRNIIVMGLEVFSLNVELIINANTNVCAGVDEMWKFQLVDLANEKNRTNEAQC